MSSNTIKAHTPPYPNNSNQTKNSTMKPFYSHLLILVLILTDTLITPSSAERCHPDDKRALLRIKQQSFEKSTMFDSWDPNTDCCNGNWSFVKCDDSTNRINDFTMLGSDTPGTPFPSAIGDLTYLDSLIFHNQATGPIPTSLSKLHHLTFIFIGLNRLTGPIPPIFHTLRNLTAINLSYNRLSGPIPPSIALAPSLIFLNLRNNRFTGPIPDMFGHIKIDTFGIDFANNKFTGELPISLREVNLYYIDVAGNDLEGDASFLFRKENPMPGTYIRLGHNSFSFNLSNVEIVPLLTILNLSHNKIYGSLPKELGNLTQLNEFDVSYNQLCGMIPTGDALQQFDSTFFSHNKCLCGAPLPNPCK